ncbi:MAG: group II intron reverse transcriptase/maturase [Firmicutes bacterium]|nr:group II intron reverse transcriptase/maturase [Bacillota bacterium]
MVKPLHSVIDKVYRMANLEKASRKVCANKGAPGVDKVTVAAWQAKEGTHLRQLHGKLYADNYRSKHVRRKYIAKQGSKKMRPLGIPAVKDRVCQQAVLNVLQPTFEEVFFEGSHGFRPGRSTRTARQAILGYRKTGYRYVVDLDIRNFFGEVDHAILMKLVREAVKDRRVLGLILGWLTAGILEEGEVRYATSGTPQGGVISPLLSNIYLTPFDLGMQAAGYVHVRYADDVLILCRTREEAEAALGKAKELLDRLKLVLSPEKTTMSSFQEGFDFLGYHFTLRHVGVAKKSLKGFYAKVRELTKRQQGDVPVEKVIEAVNARIVGWAKYHAEGDNTGLFRTLDKWVRNRVRAYVRRRWRDRGRWKVYTAEELDGKGLARMERMISRTHQLKLFESPC